MLPPPNMTGLLSPDRRSPDGRLRAPPRASRPHFVIAARGDGTPGLGRVEARDLGRRRGRVSEKCATVCVLKSLLGAMVDR